MATRRTSIKERKQDMRCDVGVRTSTMSWLGLRVHQAGLASVFEPISEGSVAVARRIRPNPECGFVRADHRFRWFEKLALKIAVVRAEGREFSVLRQASRLKGRLPAALSERDVVDSPNLWRHFLHTAEPRNGRIDTLVFQIQVAVCGLANLGRRLCPGGLKINDANDGQTSMSSSTVRSVGINRIGE